MDSRLTDSNFVSKSYLPIGTNGAKETHSIWANAIVKKNEKEEEGKEERDKKFKAMK